MTRAFAFTALDTLMFRDGRPFNQGDAGASAAQSVFPPPPPTLIGALRLALAEQNGFDGRSEKWPTALGDGVDWQANLSQLGDLQFSAPLLVRIDPEGNNHQPLFPAPLHLAEAKKGDVSELTFLLPRTEYETDLGTVWLPSAPDGYKGVKVLEGYFLDNAGMRSVLDGKVPDRVVPGGEVPLRDVSDDTKKIICSQNLWQAETRVGIGRNPDTRVANDGELYTASHTRTADNVALVLSVDGLDAKMEFDATTQRLGGEHRAAYIQICDPLILPDKPKTLNKHGNKYRYAAIALSPVLFDELPGPNEKVPGLEGTLLSACFGKAQAIGGWNFRARRPLPMRRLLPAGSVFFMECDDEAQALNCHGKKVGQAGEWGFGQVLIARWET